MATHIRERIELNLKINVQVTVHWCHRRTQQLFDEIYAIMTIPKTKQNEIYLFDILFYSLSWNAVNNVPIKFIHPTLKLPLLEGTPLGLNFQPNCLTLCS